MSALVHSSTLVTAGVYLVVRFFDYLKDAPLTSRVVLFIGTLTILIAGIAALREVDLKKIVALSTLSQLGLIISSLGIGLWKVAFFHLLCHAYIKALLFLSVGNIIHYSNRYQDMRLVAS